MFDFLSNKFSSIFSHITGRGRLTEKNIEEVLAKVQEALLEADVPYELVQAFIDDVKTEVHGQKVLASLRPDEQLLKVVHDRLKTFLGGQSSVPFSFQLPSVTMVMGLQGSGKTTTIAKMAHFVQQQAKQRGKERRILMASVDFYRPAALDQLELLARSVGVDFYRSKETNPIKAAVDIHNHYKNGQYELLFLDTAGRLHVDDTMLKELQDIDARLKPRYKLLVLDSMTGQESLRIAKAYEEQVGFQAAILSKMDSDTRCGAAFSFRYALKKPVIFVGTGEKIADLELFHPDRAAGRILGMGDLMSLVEKANATVNQSEQENAYNAMFKGKMTLQDFADQLAMVGKLGSISSLMKYLPGAGNFNVSQDMIEKGERELKKFKAIISSMTKKERIYPAVLNGSRKQRIAKGAGATVEDINLLLRRFEESQQYVKLFKRLAK
jgi:signal recognition particle subunit SRP54